MTEVEDVFAYVFLCVAEISLRGFALLQQNTLCLAVSHCGGNNARWRSIAPKAKESVAYVAPWELAGAHKGHFKGSGYIETRTVPPKQNCLFSRSRPPERLIRLTKTHPLAKKRGRSRWYVLLACSIFQLPICHL